MERLATPEDLVGQTKAPLELDVRCAPCGAEARVRVPWVTLDPRAQRGVEAGWDGVALGAIFTCAACGAVDAYEATEASYVELVREKSRGGTRVIEGLTRLWDGTLVWRPSLALAHLRGLTAAHPESAQAWRRLGNACERYELRDEALEAWRRAASASDDEFEGAYSAAAELIRIETGEMSREAARLLRLAVQRFASPNACLPHQRLAFAEGLAHHLFVLADAVVHPIVLLASWQGGRRGDKAFANLSSAELGRLQRGDTLGPFLAREDLLALDVVDKRQSEEQTMLEALLEAGSEQEAQSVERALRGVGSEPLRAAVRPGRNEPCPCGSGKKYKKCHGR
jgi:hypothetical protein